MMDKKETQPAGEMIVYRTEDGKARVECRLRKRRCGSHRR